MKASSLLPSSPRVFCPLLSSSVLFLFFGKPSGILRGSASNYCCRTGYKLLQERSPAILSRHGKTRASSVLRMAYRKRCYTLYLLFLLFSLLSRLHRNNANNPITPFSGWTNKLASHHEGLWNPLPYLDSSIGGSGQLGLSDVVMTKWRFRFLITETRRKKGRKAHIRGWCGRSKEKIRQRASKREADWRTLL